MHPDFFLIFFFFEKWVHVASLEVKADNNDPIFTWGSKAGKEKWTRDGLKPVLCNEKLD